MLRFLRSINVEEVHYTFREFLILFPPSNNVSRNFSCFKIIFSGVHGQPLSPVFVYVKSTSGTYGPYISDSNGVVTICLELGNYTISARYQRFFNGVKCYFR